MTFAEEDGVSESAVLVPEADGRVGNGISRNDPIDACRLPPARDESRDVRLGRERRWSFLGLCGRLGAAPGVTAMGGVGGMRLDEKAELEAWGLGNLTEEDG